MPGGILRFPYKFTLSNEGELSLTLSNEGTLSTSVSNEGSLSLTLSNEGSLSTSISNGGALQLNIYNPKTNETLQAGGENMVVINVYEGDYGYDLMFTVLDVDSNPFNLSGATITFKMAKVGASTLTVDAACNIVVAGNGTCSYTTVSGDFDVAGLYAAELQIAVASKVYTIADMQVNVIEDLPRGD